MLLQKSQEIRGRELEVNLSDEDVHKLIQKVSEAGITINELLSSFIGDLINGSQTNGSDERDIARSWFNRCGFQYVAEKSFLRFALSNDCLDEILELHNNIKYDKEELLEIVAKPGGYGSEDFIEIKENLKYMEDDINNYWEEYTNDYLRGEPGHQGETLEGEIEKLVRWREEYQKILDGKE